MMSLWIPLLFAVAAHPAAAKEKWAVFVGINDYQAASCPKLEGAENDARETEQVLQEVYGFRADHCKLLLSREATKKAILDALAWLKQKAGKEDLALFFFSGHGGQVPDTGHTGGSGLDEALLPCDMSMEAATNDITHHYLRQWVDSLTTDDIVVIADSCYSGSLTKSPFGQLKYVHRKFVDRALVDDEQQSGTSSHETSSTTPHTELSDSDTSSSRRKAVLLAACKADQQATDDRQTNHGAFTYYLLQELRATHSGYEDLLQSVAKAVEARFNQDPQLLGVPPDRVPFGGRAGAAEDSGGSGWITVTKVSGSTVTLSGGAAAGVRVGAVYGVYGEATTDFSDDPLGKVEVETVTGSHAEAKVLKGRASIAAGCRCVIEYASIPNGNLRVYVQSESSTLRNNVTSALKALDYVDLATESGGADRILWADHPTGEYVGELRRLDGTPTDRRHADNAEALVEKLKPDLENAYCLLRLAALSNPRPSFDLNASVNQKRFKLGEDLVISLQPERACYLTVLVVDAAGATTVLYPNKYHDAARVSARDEVRIPATGDRFKLQATEPCGLALVKVLATEENLDFTGVNLHDWNNVFKGLPRPTSGVKAIVRQLSTALGGGGELPRRKGFEVVPVKGWSSAEFIVTIAEH